MDIEKVRIDKYLWAIRIFKTRSLASEACDKGKVKWNGNTVKASKNVYIDEEYDIKTENKKWRIKIVDIIDKRVAHSVAIKNYIDITTAEEVERIQLVSTTFQTGKRLSKIGRPTKKNKRDLDDFLNSK